VKIVQVIFLKYDEWLVILLGGCFVVPVVVRE
jgi:hypothetical protein